MTRYARVRLGRVAEDPIDLPDGIVPGVHVFVPAEPHEAEDGTVIDDREHFSWLECPDPSVAQGWLHDGENFAPPPPTPSAARTATGFALLRSLTEAHVDRLSRRDVASLAALGAQSVSEDDAFVKDAARIMEIKPSTWFDAALSDQSA